MSHPTRALQTLHTPALPWPSIHFRQTAVQNLLDLSLPNGLFFVPEEYRLLADRLSKAREEKTVSEMQGCLLLGQQGVGAWA